MHAPARRPFLSLQPAVPRHSLASRHNPPCEHYVIFFRSENAGLRVESSRHRVSSLPARWYSRVATVHTWELSVRKDHERWNDECPCELLHFKKDIRNQSIISFPPKKVFSRFQHKWVWRASSWKLLFEKQTSLFARVGDILLMEQIWKERT